MESLTPTPELENSQDPFRTMTVEPATDTDQRLWTSSMAGWGMHNAFKLIAFLLAAVTLYERADWYGETG